MNYIFELGQGLVGGEVLLERIKFQGIQWALHKLSSSMLEQGKPERAFAENVVVQMKSEDDKFYLGFSKNENGEWTRLIKVVNLIEKKHDYNQIIKVPELDLIKSSELRRIFEKFGVVFLSNWEYEPQNNALNKLKRTMSAKIKAGEELSNRLIKSYGATIIDS